MSASLDLYRLLVPSHAAVPDSSIEAWLVLAARRNSAAAFGIVWQEACVFYAASGLDALVQSGQAGALSGGVCAPPVVAAGKSAKAEADNIYWVRFLELRDSRAAGAPTHIGPGSSGGTWPC